jgi:hypothetical protein
MLYVIPLPQSVYVYSSLFTHELHHSWAAAQQHLAAAEQRISCRTHCLLQSQLALPEAAANGIHSSSPPLNLLQSHHFRLLNLCMRFLQAALIVGECGGKVMEAQGELITTQYFDSLAAEINDLLQVRGNYCSSEESGTVLQIVHGVLERWTLVCLCWQ